jgi:CRP/FNR family transcriptional regulator, cyclic AMP receptor protein
MSRKTFDLPSMTFAPGAVIFRQGDPGGRTAYMVHEGRVEVRRRVGGVERKLRSLAPGDLLGEVALFRNAPHSATAVALDRVTLLTIAGERLERMILASPGLALALIRQLARMAAGADAGRR